MTTMRRYALATTCLAFLLPSALRAAEPTDADRAKAESLYKVALIAIENRDWEVARKKLTEILTIVPDQPKALLRLAGAELNLGRPSAAKKVLAKARAAGLSEGDRATADDLEPKIDYTLERQAAETPTGMLGKLGWRVTDASIANWESWGRFALAQVFYPLDTPFLILSIKLPAASNLDQEAPYDLTVRDSDHSEVFERSGVFRVARGSGCWVTAIPVGPIPPLPHKNFSQLTIELRSEGTLVVRTTASVDTAVESPSNAGLQRLAGKWVGRGKGCDSYWGKKGNLEVRAGRPFPEFAFTTTLNGDAYTVAGRMISRAEGAGWILGGATTTPGRLPSDSDGCPNWRWAGGGPEDVFIDGTKGTLSVRFKTCTFELVKE